jgi:hypothetical protein
MASSEDVHLDPQVEEVLRRVATEPGSALLRVPRPSSIKGFFDRQHAVGIAASGLSSAERQLVQAHRSDVARLLREACRMKLLSGPEGPVNVSPFRSIQEPHVRLDPEALAREARRQASADKSLTDMDPCWSLIEACVRDPRGGSPSVLQLAEASLRLEPTDEARIMAALELTQHGSPESATRILHHMLSAPLPVSIEVSAWNNLGMASPPRQHLVP